MNYGTAKAIHAAEFTKIAAPRQIQEIRRLVQEGRMEEANALAQRLQSAGVLKVTPEGTFISNPGGIGAATPEQVAQRNQRLDEIRRKRMRKEELSPKEESYFRRKGRAGIAGGAEGVADVVVGAEDRPERLTIRKTYDPQAKIFSPGQEDRKVRAGEAVRGDPRFAQIYTRDQARVNRGGSRYMIKELIEGKDIGAINRTADEALQDNRFAAGAQRDINSRVAPSYQVRDITRHGSDVIHRGNTRVDPEGNRKIVDFIVDDREGLRRYTTGSASYYPNSRPGDVDDLSLTDTDKLRVRQSFGGRTPAVGSVGVNPPPPLPTSPTPAVDTFRFTRPVPPLQSSGTFPLPPRGADTFSLSPRATAPLPGGVASNVADTVGDTGMGRALKGVAGTTGKRGLLSALALARF